MNQLREWMDAQARGIAEELASINSREVIRQSVGGFGMQQRTITLLKTLKASLFPSLYESGAATKAHLRTLAEERLHTGSELLLAIAKDVLRCNCERPERETCDHTECERQAEELTLRFMQKIPEIRRVLSTDLQAAYEGDPAARSTEEILLSYPSIEAVSTYRIAHELYVLGLPIIPRIMTEYAHTLTGIDIHPGAKIGGRFFIDHGTGVVIGETCVIGEHVKLYQGVTLGAKSFQLDADGNPVKGVKRHPNIEDDVVIYAGATILGGDVTVGKGSVVGGNAWITRSVEPNSVVYNPAPKQIAVAPNTTNSTES
ncbi:MAG: serine acetyltransferase [Eubacteriales bacterium]|nr:serine acetyltransferase [Eubacteriales bacterium]